MVDSDVVVAYFDNGNLVINDHYITSQSGSCPGVCVDTNNRIGGEDNILDYNGNNNNNKLQVKYIRKLKTGDTNGDIDIVEGEMNAIWGYVFKLKINIKTIIIIIINVYIDSIQIHYIQHNINHKLKVISKLTFSAEKQVEQLI